MSAALARRVRLRWRRRSCEAKRSEWAEAGVGVGLVGGGVDLVVDGFD